MSKLNEIFENMDEMVFVSDANSAHLLYLNKFARGKCGISLYDLDGIKSYEVLHDDELNYMLHAKMLRLGEYYEWDYHDPVTDNYYSRKATLVNDDGRIVRLEIAFDVTVREKEKQVIEELNNISRLINDATAYALQVEDADESIRSLLKYIGMNLHCDRAYIFEDSADGKTNKNTYEWCKVGIPAQKHALQDVDNKALKTWYAIFKQHSNVVIEDLEKYKKIDRDIYYVLKRQGIHSLVASPMYLEGKFIGYFGVDNPPLEFISNVSTTLSFLGNFIATQIRHRNNINRLEDLSHFDSMTGVGNRRLFNEFVHSIPCNQSIGIIYSDLNGLKEVNDTLGHEAGDQMIECMTHAWLHCAARNHVFRLGGDEFVGVFNNIEEKKLYALVHRLENEFANYQIHVSIGAVWRSCCKENIDALLKEADEKMYESKRDYYGERRRNSDENMWHIKQ